MKKFIEEDKNNMEREYTLHIANKCIAREVKNMASQELYSYYNCLL